MRTFLTDLLKRGWALYMIVIVLLVSLGKYKDSFNVIYILAVDHLAPNYDYATTVGFNNSPSKAALETGIFYYKRCTETFPGEKGQIYHMLGYYQYLNGEKNEALRTINRSIELVPVFFWSRYNRAVYYFNEKNYLKAADEFNEAVSLDMRLSVMVILNSKTYLQVLCRSSAQTKTDNPSIKLISGYETAKENITLSQKCLLNPDNPVCHEKLQMNYF